MRLRQIKLAGFKSFADPTQIDVPGHLVGVVGPNGCGKSNVMDAVRWVLGESKAAELRGESMQDVIFNGSVNRKPAGRASVELVFDNSDGRLGGEWGKFTELSVKRILTRDNASSYLINNQQVRRRDVHDLFLGTGLGPRAYAIIGQGMITRIIEARPEDLRVFLEEAAGISKYKERRRETEARLGDTRDNLTRVEDILRELDGQIERLEQQAAVAREYRELMERHDRSQTLLWLLRSREAEAERARVAREIEQGEAAVEAHLAELRAVERSLEEQRSAHFDASDGSHQAQTELARINAEIGRLETEVRLIVDARSRLAAQIDGLRQSRERRLQEGEQLARRGAELEAAGIDGQRRLEEARAACAAHDAGLPASESAYHAAREGLTAASADAASASQAIESAGLEMRTIERQQAALAQRRERLADEKRQLGAPDAERLRALEHEIAQQRQQLDEGARRSDDLEARQRELQTQRESLAEERGQAAAALQRLEARLHALREVQANVEADEKLDPWLHSQGLQALPRLFRKLEVESGWESAFEAVLRERVEALEVGRLDSLAAFGAAAPPARVAFFSTADAAAARGAATVTAPGSLAPLSDLVHGRNGADGAALTAVLGDWLAGVWTAPDLGTALAVRSQLPPGGQIVVQAGHRVSRHGVRFYAADDRKAGLLARRRESENLERQIKAQRLIDEQAVEAVARVEASLRQAQQQGQAERDAVARLRTRVHEQQLEAVRLGELIERVRHRTGQIDAEIAEVGAEQAELGRQREEIEQRFEEFDQALALRQQAVETARTGYESAERDLRARRDESRRLDAERQRLEFELATMRERRRDAEHALGVAAADAERLAQEVERAQLEAAKLDDSAARGSLEQWLQGRVGAEQAVRDARLRVDELMQTVRATEERRHKLEQELQPRHERVTELRLKEQAARLAAEQFDQQLAEAGADIVALSGLLERAPRASSLQAEITRLAQAIAALGAVNLAALDELETARQRQGFLQSQSTDLKAAIATLEDAIRKIDQETRALLQETFDQVNRHFGELFPRLFGGGEARLSMTGDEILDAGVQVMAQPPGKRNSSIHLLSGGEKALAATALVFALFKLNPAPFCLLDEVDAPLDDANTERFCDLVRSMTDATQFLFITHNKLAMELAQQLVGVTMQEQGVSRIVAVDIDSAVRLTAEAA